VSVPAAALLDTSVFIARESGRAMGALPEHVAVSVVTIGELKLGLLYATDVDTRARRGQTLSHARAADPLAITEAVMVTWAALVADCASAGLRRTTKLTDTLIAATAIEHGLPVVTQDDDYSQMAQVAPRLSVLTV
jgi:predicted nucleic acid-binding protein